MDDLEPEVFVKLTDSEFTLSELEQFIARARGIDGIPHDGLVEVSVVNAMVTTKSDSGPLRFQLSTSDSYRSKG